MNIEVCVRIDGVEYPRPKRNRLKIPIKFSGGEIVTMPQTITITDKQKFSIGPVSAVDANNNPVPLGGAVSVTSSDTTLLTITAVDALNFEAVAVPNVSGTVTITVTDTVLTDTITVTITTVPVGPEAALVIPLGTPVNQ